MLLGLLGAVVIGASWLLFGQSSTALVIGLAIALVMNGIAYWRSSTIALKAMHAYPVTEQEQPAMHAIVRELSQTANQPMPRAVRLAHRRPERLRHGRNPKNAAVCCTEGILAILDERELRGVLGHELMHVYNRDILTSSVAASASSACSPSSPTAPCTSAATSAVRTRSARSRSASSARSRRGWCRWRSRAPGSTTPTRTARRLTGDPLALASALPSSSRGKARPLPPQRDLVEHQPPDDRQPVQRPRASAACSPRTRRWRTGSPACRRWRDARPPEHEPDVDLTCRDVNDRQVDIT